MMRGYEEEDDDSLSFSQLAAKITSDDGPTWASTNNTNGAAQAGWIDPQSFDTFSDQDSSSQDQCNQVQREMWDIQREADLEHQRSARAQQTTESRSANNWQLDQSRPTTYRASFDSGARAQARSDHQQNPVASTSQHPFVPSQQHPDIIRPTPIRPPNFSNTRIPTPTGLPPNTTSYAGQRARFEPLRPQPSGIKPAPLPIVKSLHAPNSNLQHGPPLSHNHPIRATPQQQLTRKSDFPIPYNGNTRRRLDYHQRPDGGMSAFQPEFGGDYATASAKANNFVPKSNGGSKVHAAPKTWATDDDEEFAGDEDFEMMVAAADPSLFEAIPSTRARGQPFESAPQQPRKPAVVNTSRPRNGIALRPVSSLPDRYRTLWKFGVFNAIQSTCFDSIFSSDDNVVVSAPTGSGKTVLFELAILRLFSTLSDPDAKVVYMAPTKSLCSERARDWKAKFTPFGWKVVEYTGDSSLTAHREVAGASVIITTPEKWDSMTRRWNSFKKTLDTFRLFLIDECHFVGMDTRGAVLEVVVARMKTLGTRTRFLALSATAPNIEDVAEWIGSTGDDGPAKTFAFGEEYRACPLQKIVVGYPKGNMNDFVFNNTLNGKLFDLIKRHADRKPVLIFCNTRKGCLQAAEALAKEYRSFTESSARAGPWPKPARNVIKPGDKSLANLVELGIAFHHAGLDMNDRRLVEQSFIDGGISVVCCTSTLAVGVNLPCRMVIIKGTQSFADGRFVDYSDLDLIQMMGRAGRPQFDHTGVVLILTDKDQEQRFNSLVKSETLLESCLHRTLTEHINSEITLGNIDEISSALRWLRSSFLYVRIRKNPSHYAISGDETTSPDLRLEELCLKSIEELVQEGIVMQEDNGALLSTDYGDIMSRYYLSHETFLLLKAIPPKATMRALLETLSACSEFASIRFRSGEKQAYTAQNKILKYPCTKVQNNTDKICILIQLVLQCIPLNEVKTNDGNPTMEVLTIWTHLSRLVKAIVDIGLERKDGGVKTALELLRSVNAKAWDGSPFVLRQLDGIGEVSVKALSERGILSFQDVCDSDPSRIEVILNRNPPFGRKIVAQATALPKFFVNLESKAESPSDSGATIDLEVEIGLVYRDPPPTIKKSSRFFASVLLVTSDFEYIEFRRMMSDHLLKGPKSFSIRVNLVKPSQRIIALVACDDLGGSEVKAVHKPAIHSSLYPLPSVGDEENEDPKAEEIDLEDHRTFKKKPSPQKNKGIHPPVTKPNPPNGPKTLPNGMFECGHRCGDKTSCKHLCCREGLSKPPAPSRAKSKVQEEPKDSGPLKQRRLSLTTKKSATESDLKFRPAGQSTGKQRDTAPEPSNDALELSDSDGDADLPPFDELLKRPAQAVSGPRRPASKPAAGGIKYSEGHSKSVTSLQSRRGWSSSDNDVSMDEIDELATPEPSPLPSRQTSHQQTPDRPLDHCKRSSSLNVNDNEERGYKRRKISQSKEPAATSSNPLFQSLSPLCSAPSAPSTDTEALNAGGKNTNESSLSRHTKETIGPLPKNLQSSESQARAAESGQSPSIQARPSELDMDDDFEKWLAESVIIVK